MPTQHPNSLLGLRLDWRRCYRVDEATGCWLWTAHIKSGTGYGVYVRGSAHRWVYEQLIGPIPDGLELDHLCRARHCVNPAHLEPVTHRENTLRGNGPSATNARKTHCPRGHEFSHVNINGDRCCRTCITDAQRANRAARGSRHITNNQRAVLSVVVDERCGSKTEDIAASTGLAVDAVERALVSLRDRHFVEIGMAADTHSPLARGIALVERSRKRKAVRS